MRHGYKPRFGDPLEGTRGYSVGGTGIHSDLPSAPSPDGFPPGTLRGTMPRLFPHSPIAVPRLRPSSPGNQCFCPYVEWIRASSVRRVNVQNLNMPVRLIHPVHQRVVPDHRDLQPSTGESRSNASKRPNGSAKCKTPRSHRRIPQQVPAPKPTGNLLVPP